jgi:prephenate dehydrogenase
MTNSINKILIIGAGNMGAWLAEALCLDYEVAIFDTDKKRMRFLFNTHRLLKPDDVAAFAPELVINAVSLQHTIAAFDMVLPFLPADCIISDIASVKHGIHAYYHKVGLRFCSTHPMFGPTFANVKALAEQNAIIINQGDTVGKNFFLQFYKSLHLNIFDYTFEEHDQTIAYSLSIPFTSTLVFASCMKHQKAPGTTFKKHHAIAKGLLSENNYLISEILFNPFTLEQVEKISMKLNYLIELIKNRDSVNLHAYFDELRENIK